MIDQEKYVKIVVNPLEKRQEKTGGGVNNTDATFTENGIYVAPEPYTGFGTVTVNVPEPVNFGLNINQWGGSVDINGNYEHTGTCTPNFTGVKNIGAYGMQYKFAHRGDIVGTVSFGDLETVGDYGLERAFDSCEYLEGINFSKLGNVGSRGLQYVCNACSRLTHADISSITVIGQDGLSNSFRDCVNLEEADVSNIEEIGSYGMYQTFDGCSKIKVLRFTKLSVITGGYALYSCCYYCYALKNVYFNALTSQSFGTNKTQLRSFLGRVTGCTLHFPSNLDPATGSTVISGLTDYPNFGGTNTVLAFDLPATES